MTNSTNEDDDLAEGTQTYSGDNPNSGAMPDPGTEKPDPGLTDSGMADGEMTDDPSADTPPLPPL